MSADAGAVAVPARRERTRAASATRWLDFSFFAVILHARLVHSD